MTYTDDAFLNSRFTPRTFFVPDAKDAETAEYLYAAAAKNLYGETVPDARIQRLDYTHNGRKLRAEVGQPDQQGEGKVMAIFGPSAARSMYYITTLNRGMLRGDPIMVGGDEVRRVFEFLDG